MKFTKMHGLGNDYLYVAADALPSQEEAAALSIRWSDRHTGVGSDGIIWILPPSEAGAKAGAQAQMRIFNADGSEAMMCGNGIRCVGAYVYERNLVEGLREMDASAGVPLAVETLSGIKYLTLFPNAEGHVDRVAVDMGMVVVSPTRMIGPDNAVETIPVNVGNPHAVCFCQDAENAPVTTLGPVLEKDPAFPGGVNVEFVTKLDRETLRMRVWERGSGMTMACGTGACASAAAAVAEDLCPAGVPLTVKLDGGDLHITVNEVAGAYKVIMEGPAAFVCDGETL